MSFSIEKVSPDATIITIGKTLDFANSPEFRLMTESQIRAGIRTFILNFDDTIFLDSTGMGSIFSLHRQLRHNHGRVAFAAVSRPVQIVVELTHSYRVFDQYRTVEEARSAVAYEERLIE